VREERPHSSYFYPDIDDELITKFINKYGAERWAEEEREALSMVRPKIERILSRKSGVTMVDLGTGTGRLIPWLNSFKCSLKTIVATDLDRRRISSARKFYRYNGNVDFVVSSAGSCPLRNESVDFILLSHIIQHISKEEYKKIIYEMFRLLRYNGIVLMMTTHSDQEHEYYILMNKGGMKIINEDMFEQYARNPRPYSLPIRRFSINSLITHLDSAGFHIIDVVFYHTKPEYFKEFNSIKELNALGPEAHKYSIDVVILMKKRGVGSALGE